MKGEKSKIILVYVLMLLVIGLIVALTLFVLNSNKKEENHSPSTNNAPKVDVNPFPNISQECTFNLTLDEYNALTGPRCKNGYSRYNVNGLSLGGKTMNVSVVYTDQDGNKAGIYVNDRRATTVVNNVINIKFGIFDDKLFILDNNVGPVACFGTWSQHPIWVSGLPVKTSRVRLFDSKILYS